MANYFLLYAYNESGYHNGAIEIKTDVTSVAKAIMYYGSKSARLMITDIMDLPVVSTYGFMLDRWGDSSYCKFNLADLQDKIIPMQMGMKIPKSEKSFLYRE